MLQTENVIKQYRQSESVITAVNRANIKIEKGEFVAIIGSSGSGKSTFLHICAGSEGHKCASWTFTTLVKPGLTVPYITDMKAKLRLFAYYGLDYAIFEDFESIRDMSCEDFAHKYLIGNFKPARVCCGFNFSFGRGGVGDAEMLSDLLSGDGGCKKEQALRYEHCERCYALYRSRYLPPLPILLYII